MTTFLLDTNVPSELVRAVPDPQVMRWIERQAPADLFLSAITVGELIRGVERLPASKRRHTLEAWVRVSLPAQFPGRVLAFDREAASIWGEIMAAGDRTGMPRPAIDAQIGAIALHHGHTVATRNTADFGAIGVPVVNPWSP